MEAIVGRYTLLGVEVSNTEVVSVPSTFNQIDFAPLDRKINLRDKNRSVIQLGLSGKQVGALADDIHKHFPSTRKVVIRVNSKEDVRGLFNYLRGIAAKISTIIKSVEIKGAVPLASSIIHLGIHHGVRIKIHQLDGELPMVLTKAGQFRRYAQADQAWSNIEIRKSVSDKESGVIHNFSCDNFNPQSLITFVIETPTSVSIFSSEQTLDVRKALLEKNITMANRPLDIYLFGGYESDKVTVKINRAIRRFMVVQRRDMNRLAIIGRGFIDSLCIASEMGDVLTTPKSAVCINEVRLSVPCAADRPAIIRRFRLEGIDAKIHRECSHYEEIENEQCSC